MRKVHVSGTIVCLSVCLTLSLSLSRARQNKIPKITVWPSHRLWLEEEGGRAWLAVVSCIGAVQERERD